MACAPWRPSTGRRPRSPHAAALAGAIPDAQLAVVPGTSHALPMEKPVIVNQLVLDFLADEQVPKMMPTH